MRIFLTGGTGFIGSHFIQTALSHGHIVTALRRPQGRDPRIELLEQPRWLYKEIGEVSLFDLENIDILVHLAAHSANHPYDTLYNCLSWNLLAPLKLFETAREAGVTNYLATGSCFEYGLSGLRYEYIPPTAPLEPTQSYPTSKAAASIAFSQWARTNDVSLSILRLFQVYGPGEQSSRLWPSLCKAALLGEDFPMTPGMQVRDFSHVSEVASKLLIESQLIVSRKKPSLQVKNIGSGIPTTILEFSRSVWSSMQAKGRIIPGTIPYRKGEIMRYVPLL